MKDGLREKVEKLVAKKLKFLGNTGRDSNYVCPWCEKKGEVHKLHIDFGKGKGVCHGCGFGFRSLDWLLKALYDGIPSQIARWLNRPDLSVDIRKMLEETDPESESLAPASLPESFVPLPKYPTDRLGRAMLSYITDTRGYSYADVERWGAGYVVDKRDRAYGYLILPYYVGGRVVYWQGRRVCPEPASWRHGRWAAEGPPKNWNPPGSYKKAILYGFDQAVKADTGFLCEGPFDAWAWGAGGLALTSKVIHDPQARSIAFLGLQRLIVCLDGNVKGETLDMAAVISEELPNLPVGYLLLPGDGDPDNHRSRIHRLAKKRTVWPQRLDTVGRVRDILRK